MKKLVYAHLSVWAGFFLLFLPLFLMRPSIFYLPKDVNLLFLGISLMITMVSAFYMSFFLTKKYILKKIKNIRYPFIFFILLIQFIVLLDFFELISSKYLLLVFIHAILIILFASFGVILQFQIDWNNKGNKKRLELEQQNQKSQMNLLISQINPHFLFNTLHNIDALIHEDQDKASKSLVKLSDIMRYMLKDTKSDFVELKNEIEYLENYFSLESLRLKNEKFFNYSISGNYDRLKIAPMMLIPFVENAFKHAVDSGIENGIIIKIAIENKKLFFSCENQYYKSEVDKDYSHGIGLETVKQRLDLIYKSKHKLDIHSDDSVFKVNLELELNEN